MFRIPTTARRPHRRTAALAAAAALLLTGCGGADEPDDAASGTTAETSEAAPSSSAEPTESEAGETTASESEAQSQEITVGAVDFDFELDSTDLAAGEYEVTLTNEGEMPHNLVVEQDGEDVGGSDVIESGESTTFTVTLEPGDYIFYCGVGSHRAQGMEVPVTVT